MDQWVNLTPQKAMPVFLKNQDLILRVPLKYRNNVFEQNLNEFFNINNEFINQAELSFEIQQKFDTQYRQQVIQIINQLDIYENIEILSTPVTLNKQILIRVNKKNQQKERKYLVKFLIGKQNEKLKDEQMFDIKLCKVLYNEGDITKIQSCLNIFDLNLIQQKKLENQQEQQQQNQFQDQFLLGMEYDISMFSLEKILEARNEQILKFQEQNKSSVIPKQFLLKGEEFASISKKILEGFLRVHDQCMFFSNFSCFNVILRKGQFFLIDYAYNLQKIDGKQLKNVEKTDSLTSDIIINKALLRIIQNQMEGQLLNLLDKQENQDSQQNVLEQMNIDPYKIDIYNLGLVFLKLALVKENKMLDHINEIFKSQQEIEKISDILNINEYILKENKFIYIIEQKPYHYQIKNVLQMMLCQKQDERISSMKLALISGQNRILLDKLDYPQFYRKYFPPNTLKDKQIQRFIDKNPEEFKSNDQAEELNNGYQFIEYSFKPMLYQGNINQAQQRDGKGKLWKIVNKNKIVLLYEGTWKNDQPEGIGNIRLYQDLWNFEGQFTNGRLSSGKIMFKGNEVYSGDFFNYLQLDWLVRKEVTDRFLVDNSYSINFNDFDAWTLVNSNNSQDIALGGKTIFVQIEKKTYKIDYQTFDLLIQIPSPIIRINLNYFSDQSIEKLQHLLPNSANFEELKKIQIQIRGQKEYQLLLNYLNQGEKFQLEELDLSDSVDLVFQNNQLAQVLNQKDSKLQNLKSLNFSKIKEPISNFLRSLTFKCQNIMRNIQEIDLSQSTLDNKSLESLFQQKLYCRNLKKFSLKYVNKINSEGMQIFNHYMSNMDKLEYLDLSGILSNSSTIGFFGDSNQEAFKKFASHLKYLVNLKTLILDNTSVSDSSIETLAGTSLKNLETLSLNGCLKVTFKGIFWLQVSGNQPNLQKINLDRSGVALPKPTREKWNNIHLSIVDAKQVDLSNLYEYLRAAKKVKQLTMKAFFLQNDINNVINYSSLEQINLIIETQQDIHLIFQFLKVCQKDELILNIHNISKPQAESFQAQLENYYQNKEIKESRFQNIRFNGEDMEVYFEKAGIIKINSKQFLNTYISREQDPPELIEGGGHQIFKLDFQYLLNHEKLMIREFLDISTNYLSKEAINILLSSTSTKNLKGINLSNSDIKSKQIEKLSKNETFQNLDSIYLKNCKDEALAGMQHFVNSTVLKNLKTIYLGNCNISILINTLLKYNALVVVVFGDIEQKVENPLEFVVDPNNDPKQSYSIYVAKGESQKGVQQIQGINERPYGRLKLKINSFTTLVMNNEKNVKNIQLLINEIIRFKNFGKQQQLPQKIMQSDKSQINLLVLGDQLVGKQAVCKRWCFNIFSENQIRSPIFSRFYNNEISILNQSKKLINVKVNLITMQQLECMQSFQRYQYQEVDGILLLVDVTDPLVKEQLQGFGEEFKYLKRDKSIYMVGNKSDLENERQISESELEELVKEMDFYYSEISAKSGNNVNKLFQKIVTECVNHKNSSVVHTGDQIVNLIQQIQSIKFDKLKIKFNFIKSRAKIQANNMEDICKIINNSTNMKFVEIFIKNWYSVNDYEKNKITTNLQSNKLMVKVNNSKRKTSSFSATRNRQSSLVQFVQQKFGEQSGLNNNNSGVQNQQSLSQGNLQEENNDNNNNDNDNNDNQKNNLGENRDKNQENDQEFKDGEIEKKNQGQDLEKLNSKNSQNESDQNNNNKNQSENSSGHNLMNKGGIEIIQEENI